MAAFAREVLSGYLRGFGISVLPTASVAAGICSIRLTWVFTVFRLVPTLRHHYAGVSSQPGDDGSCGAGGDPDRKALPAVCDPESRLAGWISISEFTAGLQRNV